MSESPGLMPTPLAEPLDEYLREVVRTLQTAVSQGMRRAAANPTAAGRQVTDCRDILQVIMAGNVEGWLST